MEDSHICEGILNNETALFGVFDGHGGMWIKIINKIFLNFLMIIYFKQL